MKQGWTYKKLGDIASYVNGFPFKPTDWVEDGKPIIRIQNLTGSQSKFNRCSRDDIPSKYFVKRGDILISWSATLGVYEWELEDALLNQHIFKVVFDKIKINKSFFRYAIIISLAEMGRHTNGATMKHIRKGDFDNIEIPIPSLAEQERIVERLDAAFAQIDELKSNAEQQLAEARALFQSALTQAMQPKPGWQEKTLPDISENLDSIRVPVTKKNRSTGIYPYYGASGIVDYVDDYLFDEDLLCISEDGANLIMRTYPIAFPIKGKVWVNNHAHVLRFNNLTTQKYVEYYFEGLKLDEYVTGAAQPKLTQKALNRIVINLPSSINEQQKIVSYLDSLTNHVKELEEICRKAAADCDVMKQALLRQIFE